jgi:hypothetical protein
MAGQHSPCLAVHSLEVDLTAVLGDQARSLGRLTITPLDENYNGLVRQYFRLGCAGGRVFFAHYEPRFRDNEQRTATNRPLRGGPAATRPAPPAGAAEPAEW